LHLCRGIYSSKLGFILGDLTPGSGGAIPRLIDKRTTGTTDDTIISEPFLERYIQGPRNELRGSGIIREASIDSAVDNTDGTCTITVNPGVLVVNGIRFEYLGVQELLYRYGEDETDLNNFYIALDGFGCLTIENEVDSDGLGTFISPFSDQVVAHLGYVEPDGIGSTLTPTDLRLFVDHLDYKIIADITVANDQRFGHFTDIKTAVDYTRMFTKMFPDMGTPSIFIKEGTHKVSEKIYIDFDIKIHGSGPQTIIQRDAAHPPGGGTNTGAWNPIFQIGSEVDTDIVNIVNGVTFENFTYKVDYSLFSPGENPGNTDSVFDIQLRLDTNDSENAVTTFNKINFIGSSSATVTAGYGSSEGYELAFYLGPNQGSDGIYGNILISNCFFDYIGYGRGVMRVDNDADGIEHLIITQNICKNSIWSTDGVTPDYNLFIMSGSYGGTLNGYVESNNTIYPLIGP
jgi:hypothetical protein